MPHILNYLTEYFLIVPIVQQSLELYHHLKAVHNIVHIKIQNLFRQLKSLLREFMHLKIEH